MNRTVVWDILHLVRVRQWYKNSVVFLALFFSRNLFSLDLFLLTILGFISLCFVSSAGYIINDMKDIHTDRMHPERRTRPLAAKRISYVFASVLLIFLLVIGFIFAGIVNIFFLFGVLTLFILSILYTFIFKQILFGDILTIATLFVIRAITGAIAISVWISPWLLLCPFFLSLFFVIGKRHADTLLLQRKMNHARTVLEGYVPEITLGLMNIATTLLIISYALYSFLSDHIGLLYTIPVALFIIFRYYLLTIQGSVIARQPEKMFRNIPIALAGCILLIMIFFVLYL